MIPRLAEQEIREALGREAAVAIIFRRQVGKTTLAQEIAECRPSACPDLESSQDRARLQEPELYFERQAGKLVILDEIRRIPDLFQPLRGVIDQARRAGRRTGP
jgi:uncharacterized protein